jgi:hypothetical protein
MKYSASVLSFMYALVAATASTDMSSSKIKHVVILMLEVRSFFAHITPMFSDIISHRIELLTICWDS